MQQEAEVAKKNQEARKATDAKRVELMRKIDAAERGPDIVKSELELSKRLQEIRKDQAK
jgi:hypothetical protein